MSSDPRKRPGRKRSSSSSSRGRSRSKRPSAPRQGNLLDDTVGETGTALEAPSERRVSMPASHRRPYDDHSLSVAGLSADHLDIETISMLLDSHAELAGVRLAIVTKASGSTLFEATPGDARELARELEAPITLESCPPLVLRGSLSVRKLERVAAAIEHALHLRSASGARQQALDAERERLSLVFDFSEKVCQLAALDDVIERFLGDVTRILGAREGTFFALDKRRKDLYIRCHYGSDPEVVRNFRLKIGEGIAGAVAKDGRPRIVNDVENCPDYVAKTNPIRNIISAPVTVHERLIGVINVNDRQGGKQPFSNRDLQLLVSLARLGGIALDNAKLYDEVRALMLSTVESLTTAIDAKNEPMRGHSRRVSFLADAMAERLGLAEQERDLVRIAAMLHDVGNLAVPDEVLDKKGRLDSDESAAVRKHPALGAAILAPVRQLAAVLPGVLDHHERYDGRGYPRRLKGEEISMQGRLVAIAEAYDAMTHDRPFRPACKPSAALREITKEAGTQFDPALVPVFVDIYNKLDLERSRIDDLIPSDEPDLDF
ncbi:MAG: GAF domain-containing protein [Myxococcales bacterium]|nr:GAF domain-containing protein [Myxococcales bacterium]